MDPRSTKESDDFGARDGAGGGGEGDGGGGGGDDGAGAGRKPAAGMAGGAGTAGSAAGLASPRSAASAVIAWALPGSCSCTRPKTAIAFSVAPARASASPSA